MDVVVEPVAAAPWGRIAFGPAVDWDDADREAAAGAPIPARAGDHSTILRWERRVDVDTGRSFHATAVRLETSTGVQHESQWRVELDGRAERLTLHWLRVVRGGRRIDHLRRECMRLMQRETQMEWLMLDGSWTLLAVLDDVRVGDVIEAGYSFESTHPIRGRGCEAFFGLPPQAMIGAWTFIVRAGAERAARLAWRASADAPAVRDEESGGRRLLTWQGAQTTPREPEPNAPVASIDHLWVQVSDLAEWSELATAVAAAWAKVADADGIEAEPAFARPEVVDEAAILRVITHIQEEFRYLSLNLEAGGWVPSTPREVTRRRHGDCKDLAWLAATVLRRWGVAARPILVGSGFRERVAELLPMALAFNHAILEVEWAGRSRWFDLTTRAQGGDFETRPVVWFGRGLPVDAADNALRAQPGTKAPGVHAITETILLDTRPDAASMVESRVRVEGWAADNMRAQRAAQGEEVFAKDREEMAKRRYGTARRVGSLLWRDDRAGNVCETVEVFEINAHLESGAGAVLAVFQVPPCVIATSFDLPEDKPRRLAWAMPCPLEVRHRIEVRTGDRPKLTPRRRRWDEPEFEAATESTISSQGWVWSYRFLVKAPEIVIARVPGYRKQFGELLTECGWRLTIPRGKARPRRGDGFGELAGASVSAATARVETTVRTEATARAEATAPSGEASEEMKLSRAEAAAKAKLAGGGAGRRRRSSSEPRRRSRRTGTHWAENVPAGVFRIGLFLLLGIGFAVVRGCLRDGG